jgi:hypothetical protein
MTTPRLILAPKPCRCKRDVRGRPIVVGRRRGGQASAPYEKARFQPLYGEQLTTNKALLRFRKAAPELFIRPRNIEAGRHLASVRSFPLDQVIPPGRARGQSLRDLAASTMLAAQPGAFRADGFQRAFHAQHHRFVASTSIALREGWIGSSLRITLNGDRDCRSKALDRPENQINPRIIPDAVLPNATRRHGFKRHGVAKSARRQGR